MVFLKEWIGQDYQTWVQDGVNEYCSELVIPVKTLSANKVTPKAEQSVKFNNLIQRSFIPGGEWFYTKVYLNDTFSDQFLITVLRPFLQQVKKKGWIKQAFFIRYSDPDYHLRIRFQLTHSHYVHLGKAWQKALITLLESGFIYRMQLDTYQRELERYNPELIEDCEAIFSHDSTCFLTWLEKKGESTEEDRIRLALYSVDSLLTDFTLSIEQKVSISLQLQQAFLKEHVIYKELRKKLNQKYRDHRHSFFIQSQLDTSLLEERSLMIEAPVKKIKNYFIQSKDSKPFFRF
ncbi:thiopeptide-type bacteriocin biosynthesis protein [Spirosoma telluris]